MSRESDAAELASHCADDTALKRVDEQHRAVVEELFRQYHDLLVTSMMTITKSRQAAEDVVADAFNIFVSLPDPGSLRSREAYLYKIARNLAYEEYGDRKRLVPTDWSSSSGFSEPLDQSPSPESALIMGQDAELVHRGIARMPSPRRLIMQWRLWATNSTREIVERCKESGFQVSERTVQREIARGVEELHRAIQIANGATKERRT